MKASLVLFKSEITEKGHPVYLRLSENNKRPKKVVFHSAIEDWDFEKSEILKTHPNYNLLISKNLLLKSKVKKVNLGEMDFNQAKGFLFGETQSVSIEFDAAVRSGLGDSTNDDLYRTVLNSFKVYYPNISIKDIDKNVAKSYMNKLLDKGNGANGVHTYMRTLNAAFNEVSDLPNPFKGVRPSKEETAEKDLSAEDFRKLATTCTVSYRVNHRSDNVTINYNRCYWLLLFYFGGIDMEALSRLRYDKHVKDGRLQFNRGKGGTSVFVNNIIVDEAWRILELFDCYPYLVPIYKYKNYREYVNNFNKRFPEQLKDLKLTKRPLTKSARYTFINFALDLFIDERITMEIVGHKQKSTHSIYKRAVPQSIKDEAHKKICEYYLSALENVKIPLK